MATEWNSADLWSLDKCKVWYLFRSEEIVARLGSVDTSSMGAFLQDRQRDSIGRPIFHITKEVEARIASNPQKQLMEALTSGKLTAVGRYFPRAYFAEVPREYWVEKAGGHLVYRSKFQNGPYFVRGVPKADVQRYWPDPSAAWAGGPSNAAERSDKDACVQFFRSLGPWTASIPTKAAALAFAKKLYPKLSHRALERAWADGADRSRRVPGRRPLKSTQFS